MNTKLRIDKAIDALVNTKYEEARKTTEWFHVREITQAVKAVSWVNKEFSRVSGGPMEWEVIATRYISKRVGDLLRRKTGVDGLRLWECYPVPGQVERRWHPARSFTPRLMEASGKVKMEQGRLTMKEGMQQVAIAQAALTLGIAPDQSIDSVYEQAVALAKGQKVA